MSRYFRIDIMKKELVSLKKICTDSLNAYIKQITLLFVVLSILIAGITTYLYFCFSPFYISFIVMGVLMFLMVLLLVWYLLLYLYSKKYLTYISNKQYQDAIDYINHKMESIKLFHQIFLTDLANLYFRVGDLEKYHMTLDKIHNATYLKYSLAFSRCLCALNDKKYQEAQDIYNLFFEFIYKQRKVDLLAKYQLETLALLFKKFDGNDVDENLIEYDVYFQIPILHDLINDHSIVEFNYNVNPVDVINEKNLKLKQPVLAIILTSIASISAIFVSLITLAIIYAFIIGDNPNVSPYEHAWVFLVFIIIPVLTMIYGIFKKVQDRRYKTSIVIFISIFSICLLIMFFLAFTFTNNPNITSSIPSSSL